MDGILDAEKSLLRKRREELMKRIKAAKSVEELDAIEAEITRFNEHPDEKALKVMFDQLFPRPSKN